MNLSTSAKGNRMAGQFNVEQLKLWLPWLADAPLFIDAAQVSAFYDAVVRPESDGGPITLEITGATTKKLSGEVGGEAEASVDTWLKKLFPFLDAKIKGMANVTGGHDTTHQEKAIVQL